mgnify:CR=1 FL=1
MPKLRKTFKVLGLALGSLLALGLGTGLAAWGLANTDAGRAWLTAQAEAALSDDAARAELSGLAGPLPQRLSFERLRLRDADGVWLTVSGARLSWRPLALLRGRVEIAALEAETIALERLPAADESSPASPADAGVALPRLPLPLRLERLAVDRLTLGEAVAGQPAVFRISGQGAAPVDDALETTLSVERLDGPGGTLGLSAGFQPDSQRLRLDLSLDGAPGGVLAGQLGLAGDARVSARLSGDGPLDAWRGTLNARLGPDAGLDLDLALNEARRLTLTGTAKVAALAPAPLPALLGGPVDLDLSLARAGESGLRVRPSTLATPTLRLDLEGRLDDAGQIAAEAALTLKDPGPLNALTGPAAALAGLSLTARAEGPTTAPSLTLDGRLDRLATPEATLHDLRLQGSFDPAPDFGGGRIAAEAEAARLDPGLSALAGYADAPVTLGLDGDLDLAAGRLNGAEARLSLGETALTLADLAADLDSGAVEGRLSLDIPRLARLEPVLTLGLTGRGRLAGPIRVTPAAETLLRADLAGGLHDATWGAAPVLDALAGGALELATRAEVAADGALSLADLRLSGPNARLTGRLALPVDFARLEGGFDVALPDLAPLGAALDVPLSGAAEGRVTLDGPTGNPNADLDLTGEAVTLADVPLGDAQIQVTLASLAEDLNGRLRLTAPGSPAGAAEIETRMALGAEALRLSGLRAQIPGLALDAPALTVPLAGGALQGSATLNLASLAELHPGLAVPLRGWGVLRVDLEAGPRGQRLRLNGQVHEIALKDGASGGPGDAPRAETLDLSATLDDAFGTPRGEAELRLDGVAADPLTLESVRLSARGGLDAAELRLNAEGDLFGPLALDAAGRVAQEGPRLTARLASLALDLQGRRLALSQPATLTQSPDRLSLKDLALTLGEGERAGSLRLDAARRDGQVEIAAELDSLPIGLANLALAQPQLTGRLDGTLRLDGPATAPTGRLELSARQVTVAGAEMPPLDARLEADLDTEGLRGAARVTGLSEEPITLAGRLPAKLSLAPPGFSIAREAPLQARLDWSGELAPLMPLVPVAGHRVGGQATVALEIGGTLAAPVPEGAITITDGVYENLETGTLLSDLTARIEGREQRLEIVGFEANDGGKGTVTLDGGLDLGAAPAPRLDLTVKARKAVLLRRDAGTVRTRMDLDIAGPLQDLLIAGRVRVEEAALLVPRGLPAEVAELDVVEVGNGSNGGDGAQAADADADAGANGDSGKGSDSASRIRLDIAVEVPNQAFLRGQGLDSEWAGALQVTGTASAPVITGQLEAVRGRIDALGRAFTLESGTVSFDGGDRIDPEIDTEAVHQGEALTVTARVSGPASNPSFTLSSTPELPRDEILARLLFGEDITELSPGQAAQLAAAAAELSGVTGGGPGLLDQVRNAVGLDVLSLGGGSGTSVTAGRYLTDDVFVGVEQGLEAESSQVTVELGLTDNIAVESNVGATGQSNVGIQFKWDY